MTTDTTRRGFLAGLLTITVVAVLPTPPAIAVARPLNPFDVKAPDGFVYQWVRTALLGIPDPESVQKRLDNGWDFVRAGAHDGVPTAILGDVIDKCGLVLMWKDRASYEAAIQQGKEEAKRLQAAMLGTTPEEMKDWSRRTSDPDFEEWSSWPKGGDITHIGSTRGTDET